MIASEDIGHWVAIVFANFEDFIGKSEEIAGDELTYTQIVRTFRPTGGCGPSFSVAGHPLERPALLCAQNVRMVGF